MDADFSHNPNDIQRLLNKIQDGYDQTEEASKASDPRSIQKAISPKAKYDMVIGSRYLKNSKILNWGLKRTIFSKFANIYARIILGIPISDYTNGYRCYTAEALKAIEFDKISAAGYIVLSEMSYQLHKKGFRIGEIPITFVNRRRGASNLSRHEITSAFTSVLRLKFK